MALIGDFLEQYRGQFYTAFRVLIGLAFFLHGAQKLFGWFGGVGGGTVELFSMFGAAGVIELVGGALIALGLLTRLAAVFGIADMVAAWFIVHVGNGWIPLTNGGEAALLFFTAFLLLAVHGNGGGSLESAFTENEVF